MKYRSPVIVVAFLSLAGCAASPSAPAGAPAAPAAPAAEKVAKVTIDPQVLEGCTASPLSGLGWSYNCEGFAATVVDLGEAVAKDVLDGTASGFRQSLKGKTDGKIDEATISYEIAGKPREMRRLTLTTKGTVQGRSDATVILIEGSGNRLLTCGGVASAKVNDRCHAFFESAIASEWRDDAAPGIPVVNDKVTLAGRAVAIPKNCHAAKPADGGAMIWCDGTLSTWWMEDKGNNPALGREHFVSSVGGKASRVPCKLESVATECDMATDATGTAWRAPAKVRGRSIVAFCAAPDNVVSTMCTSILTMKH